MKYKVLYNGINIPLIGFGTWQTEGIDTYNSVLTALRSGYNHIDTAQGYNNEEFVGKAIKDSGINRQEIFVTTKLKNDIRGYNETIKSFNESLKALDMDYVDLFLIHWPRPKKYHDNYIEKNIESWKAMEDLYKSKKIRAIGVSNFLPHHLIELMQSTSIKPMVNQIRLFPGLNQEELVNYCNANSIIVEAYSPLGTGKVLEVDELKQIAFKYKKSVAQICIRYQIEKGIVVLPKSITETRIINNLNVFDFSLDKDDMEIINRLKNYVSPLKDIDNIDY